MHTNMDSDTLRITTNQVPNMGLDTLRIPMKKFRSHHPHKPKKKGRPIKPEILKKTTMTKFRTGYRLTMAMEHYAKQRQIGKSELIRDALEHYFKHVIPSLKGAKRQINKKVYVDYRKRPIVDYQFAFDDHIAIPTEIEEAFYDWFSDDDE